MVEYPNNIVTEKQVGSITDYCIVALNSENEREEMANIYETHRHAMYEVAFRITQNTQIAEDAVHNAFVSLMKHKDKYFSLDKDELQKVLAVIAMRKSYDLLRKNRFIADVRIYKCLCRMT